MATVKINGVERKVPRGIWQDAEGYINIRIFPQGAAGKPFIQRIGRTSPDVLRAAVKRLYEVRDQIACGEFNATPKQQRITTAQALDMMFETHGANLPSSNSMESRIEKNEKRLLGQRWWDELTFLDIEAYRKTRLSEGASISYINKEHSDFTLTYNQLKALNRLGKLTPPIKMPQENPGSLVNKQSERTHARKRVLTREEQEIVLSVACPQVKRIFLGALNSLLRANDLRNLSIAKHYDRAHNRFMVVQSKTQLPVEVPVNPVLQSLMNTAKGGRLFDFSNFRKLFVADRMKAIAKGVPTFQLRDLRRTGATQMFEDGGDLDTIRKMLGHTDITMTQRYLSLPDSYMEEAARKQGERYIHHLTGLNEPPTPPPSHATVGNTVSKEKEDALQFNFKIVSA